MKRRHASCIACLRIAVPEERKNCGVSLSNEKAPTFYSLEFPVLQFSSDARFNRWRMRNAFAEGVQQGFSEVAIVAQFLRDRKRDRQHHEFRLLTYGGALQKQAAFANAPFAQNGKRGGSAGGKALLNA